MDDLVRVPVNRRAIAVRVAVFVAIVVLVAIIVVLRNGNPGPSSPPGPSAPAISRTDQPAGHHPQFQNCEQARAAGRTNIPAGDPDYQAAMDRDGDGIACEVGRD